MRLQYLKTYDQENTMGQGASVSLWFNGCSHQCPGCFNQETWEFDETLEVPNKEVVNRVMDALDGPARLNTLTLLGGDPLNPRNVMDMIEIVSEIKNRRPDTQVVCWTGFTWRQVVNSKLLAPALEYIDVLIDGRYERELTVKGKPFGSSNQKVIDVPKSLEAKELVYFGNFHVEEDI